VTRLVAAFRELDADDSVRCIVLTGTDRAFAAGADIEEMAGASPIDMYLGDYLEHWDQIASIKTPIVAAVAGWCLGGGLELAMACDIIIAADNAKFGQPEIDIGVIPGAGGTQRLPRAVGKSLAMEMILTARQLSADDALRLGLCSRVVAPDALVEEAVSLGSAIAARPPLAVRAAKDAINRSQDLPIEAGVAYERTLFFLLFASADKSEGMDAFRNKRKPTWQGR
jgi:enoyl-CoA hydratase